MTVRDSIQVVIDSLDDERAATVLAFAQFIAHEANGEGENALVTEASGQPIEFLRRGKPSSADNPLSNIVGVIDNDGPTDMAEIHDKPCRSVCRFARGVSIEAVDWSRGIFIDTAAFVALALEHDQGFTRNTCPTRTLAHCSHGLTKYQALRQIGVLDSTFNLSL